MIKKLKKRIVFWIHCDLLSELDIFSQKRGWSRSLVIREAIKSFMRNDFFTIPYCETYDLEELKKAAEDRGIKIT